MARPPSGPSQAQNLDAEAEAKKRLEVILETVAGHKTVTAACAELGLSESRFHVIREQALEAAAKRLERRSAGRPPRAKPSAEAQRIAELEAQVNELEIARRAAEVRAELAISMPEVLRPPAEVKKKLGRHKPPKPKRTNAQRRRQKRGKR